MIINKFFTVRERNKKKGEKIFGMIFSILKSVFFYENLRNLR